MRPWPRRMLPFWEYSATFFDVATGVAVLPVLAQVLGLYGWRTWRRGAPSDDALPVRRTRRDEWLGLVIATVAGQVNHPRLQGVIIVSL